MAQQYKGNQDFRGYLNANDSTRWILGYVGNDGGINYGKATNNMFYNTDTFGYRYDNGYGSRQAYDKNEFQNLVKNYYNQYVNGAAEDKRNADLQAIIAATRTPQPRFINYDITGSWNKAREMATQAVSPIYQQKMTDFINRQQQELGRKQTDTVTGKSALDQALARLMEDTGTQRTRTAEDTTANIQDINDTLAFNTRAESLNYDAASRALTEGLGAGNMADSGLGQQQLQEANLARREQSNETIRQSENKVEAQNTLMNRTFQDLELKETRSSQDTTSGKQKLDLDLERFIEDQAYERDQTQKDLDLKKAADIASKSIGIQGQLVDQWIASLSGKGYTAQEIANAASIYK